MRNIALLLGIVLSWFVAVNSVAQTYRILVKQPGSKTWQYANEKGEIVIDRKDPISYEFSEDGIAAVDFPKQNLHILINIKGEKISTKVENFKLKGVFGYGLKGYSSGLVVVEQNKKFGCLDTKGEVAIPFEYDDITEFDNGYGIGQIGTDFFVLSKDGKQTQLKLSNIKEVKHFQENLAPVITNDGKFGFVNTSGELVIPTVFKGVGYFCNGLAWVRNNSEDIGFINTKGELAIKPQFKAVKDFDKESGLAMVKLGEIWTYVNREGAVLPYTNSDKPERFIEGLAEGRKGNLVGFYNTDGKWIIQPQFEAARSFQNGFAAVKLKGLWGLINKEGNWVIQPTFDDMKDMVIIN